MSLSLISSKASMVISRPVKPVPPVLIIISSASSHQPRIVFFICSLSSFKIFLLTITCPNSLILSTKIFPDVSVESFLVSEIVKTAILTGINFIVLSVLLFFV